MEFETYAYPNKKDMHNENEVPIDEDNHMMDAIRYGLEGYSRPADTSLLPDESIQLATI